MRFVVIDFETYFDAEYTLKKLSTEEYIRDPRFEVHGAAIKWQKNIPARWYDARELEWVLKNEDWSDVILCCHHSQFDGLILSHHYAVRPRKWACTLSMARLLFGQHLSVSLDSVRRHFNMPAKSTPYGAFKGKHWSELSPDTRQWIGRGACDEVESIWNLFGIMHKQFPPEEYEVIDATIRMFTEPCLRADVNLLAEVWEAENNKKADRLSSLGIVAADVQSMKGFAKLLRDRGIEPETKTSPTGREIFAFAKTDQFMRDLLEDPDDEIRALTEARLGQKSTQLQTRAEAFGRMAQRGPLCVYLRYAGTHSVRWAGGDKTNFQNLKRADPDNPKKTSPLRRAILAPEGHLLAPIDLSQIEMRLLEYLAGEKESLDELRSGVDPYCGIASMFYKQTVTKEDKEKRGTGKQIRLSCGYGSSALKFQQTAKLGIYGPPVYLELYEAEEAVDLYRDTHPGVMLYWKMAGRLISRLAGGEPYQWGPMQVKDKKIYGPGGTFLNYETLEYYVPTHEEIIERDLPEYKWRGYWRYQKREGWSELYGTKLVAETTQWLARIIMSQAMVRILARGYRIANTTHDELLVVVPKDGREKEHLQILINEMRLEPSWLPGIPLDAEGSLGERYEK